MFVFVACFLVCFLGIQIFLFFVWDLCILCHMYSSQRFSPILLDVSLLGWQVFFCLDVQKLFNFVWSHCGLLILFFVTLENHNLCLYAEVYSVPFLWHFRVQILCEVYDPFTVEIHEKKRDRNLASLLCMLIYSLSSMTYTRCCPSFNYIFGIFVKKSDGYRLISVSHILFHWPMCLFCVILCYFYTMALHYSLKYSVGIHPNMFFLLKNSLSTHSIFCFVEILGFFSTVCVERSCNFLKLELHESW